MELVSEIINTHVKVILCQVNQISGCNIICSSDLPLKIQYVSAPK